jgi:two-component system, OmpR family, phosphate regulon sensor histidine kinase PhoR
VRGRLFSKLALAFIAVGVLVVVLAGVFIERQLRTGLTAWIEAELIAKAQLIARMPAEEIGRQALSLAQIAGARLTYIDAAGRVIADSDLSEIESAENRFHRPEVQEARLRGKGSAIRYSQTRKLRFLYVAVPLASGGYVRLARPLQEATGSIDEIRLPLLTDLAIVVGLVLLLALIFTLRTVRPIGRLAAFTDRIRRGDLSGKIRVEARDEIGQLAANLNEIIATLQEKIRTADEERRKLESVITGMTEGIVVLDTAHQIETTNRGMAKLLGCHYGDMAGKTLLEAFRNIPLHDAFEKFRQTGQTVFLETSLASDPPLVLDVTITAIPGDSDEERKTLLVFHDVTRLKQLERVRTDFVANVTHEIRTPLTAIIGFVETLLQGAAPDPQTARSFLETIQANAQRLNRLVDDLLTLSGFELGEMKLTLEVLPLSEALDQALAVVAAAAAQKGVRLAKEVPAELPPIRADRDRLAQILLNVLDNAVKFSPAGGQVTLTAAVEAGQMALRIADRGPGIPKHEIPRLGERFYRADKARSRDLGGTGLGLSIVKHLIKAHGGSVAIESTLGRGTTIVLSFPLADEAQP